MLTADSSACGDTSPDFQMRSSSMDRTCANSFPIYHEVDLIPIFNKFAISMMDADTQSNVVLLPILRISEALDELDCYVSKDRINSYLTKNNFKGYNGFNYKELCDMYDYFQVNSAVMERLKECLSEFDHDKDGYLTQNDIMKYFSSTFAKNKYGDQNFCILWAELDKQGTGRVSINSFLRVLFVNYDERWQRMRDAQNMRRNVVDTSYQDAEELEIEVDNISEMDIYSMKGERAASDGNLIDANGGNARGISTSIYNLEDSTMERDECEEGQEESEAQSSRKTSEQCCVLS